MVRRTLSQEEIELNEKSIDRLKKRNTYLEGYYIPKTKLEIKVGLEKVYLETKQQYQKAVSEWEQELKTNEEQINILKDQIKNGVIKKDTSVK